MGDGNIGINTYVNRYLELCPGKALTLEIIVTGARKFAYFEPKFWEAYQNVPASNFARFVSLVDKGTPRMASPPTPKEQVAQRQREDLEASMQWLKTYLEKQA